MLTHHATVVQYTEIARMHCRCRKSALSACRRGAAPSPTLVRALASGGRGGILTVRRWNPVSFLTDVALKAAKDHLPAGPGLHTGNGVAGLERPNLSGKAPIAHKRLVLGGACRVHRSSSNVRCEVASRCAGTADMGDVIEEPVDEITGSIRAAANGLVALCASPTTSTLKGAVAGNSHSHRENPQIPCPRKLR
jgi:hypothetical protein